MQIWQALRPLDDDERESVMRTIRSVFKVADHQDRLGRAMTEEEVKALVADGLMTIGAHTVTHPVLSALEPAACGHEITGSKLACESLLDTPVVSFAYPYGDFDANVREEVRRAGFALACSTQRAPVTIMSDILALPRIYMTNVNGDEFERVLRVASAVG
jgi:peptidoglycan/xylan/chitin deacetylase (PgdA/CDA1 family)